MKRALSLLVTLSLLVAFSATLTSCTGSFEPAASFSDPEVYNKVFFGGSITTSSSEGEGEGAVSRLAYAGNTNKDYTDEKTYTYNDYLGATTGLNWNPHSWETNDDSYTLGYQSMGFYDFVLNSDLTGYAVVCEMAAELPVDVTSDYIGRFGITEGERARAWKIALNPSAKWHDGTPIKADDYIKSMQYQLDPLLLNRRADSYYAGDLQLVGAKAYLYSGRTVGSDNFDGKSYTFNDLGDLTKGAGGVYTLGGERVYIALTDPLNHLGGYSLADYTAAYGESYFDMTAYASLEALAGEGGRVVLTDESLALIKRVITGVKEWGEDDADWINYAYVDYTYPEADWSSVGLLKTGEYEIVIVYTAPVSQPGFYLPYNLSSTWLVKCDLYESLLKYYDKNGNLTTDKSAAVKATSTYGTSLATNASYGPYVLTKFQADTELVFERNENWYGYKDGRHRGQFQTDKISVRVIKEHATALQSFLGGDITEIALDSSDMEIYSSSDRIRYTPQDYTTKITFNTAYDKLRLLGGGAQILAVKEFRQAFALSLDREHFASAFTAAGTAGFGLLNYQYCYDPFTGAIYRDSDAAKRAIVDLYGISYGEGGDFASLDAAYEAVTGYDMAAAKRLMQKAYDKALEAGIYDGKSDITLDFRVYSTDEVYVKMFTYCEEQIKKACVGTGFEGKISLTMTADEDYYETLAAGNTAIIFSTWGGSAMSPFTIISQVYTDASDGSGNQMEIGYKTEKIQVKFTVDGKDYQASLKDWADWIGSLKVDSLASLGEFTSYSYETRCEFFAAIERIYLEGFANTPLYYRNTASLLSKKVDAPTENYIQLVGTGGIRYLYYNFDDASWGAVKANIKY
ncbi:MAG: hypothetical protein IJY65_01820 [Clostridia bacterium]|nr:hypothetical protein [Clostridia bacterium]